MARALIHMPPTARRGTPCERQGAAVALARDAPGPGSSKMYFRLNPLQLWSARAIRSIRARFC